MDDQHPEAGLARAIRSAREAAGLTQGQLANLVGFSREYVSRAERPAKGLASQGLVEAIDAALDAGGALAEQRERLQSQRLARRGASHMPPRRPTRSRDPLAEDPAAGLGGGIDVSPLDSALARPVPSRYERVDASSDGSSAGSSSRTGAMGIGPMFGCVDDFASAHLEPEETVVLGSSIVSSIVARYAAEGPELLRPEAGAARALCSRMLSLRVDRATRCALFGVTARLTGLLSYMSVNCSRNVEAEKYAIDATFLAVAADEVDLLAWVKGTQSLGAYYRGDYARALDFASAGLAIAPKDSEQRTRLLSNGVARAAARLGDLDTFRRAADEAQALAAGGMHLGPCISFAPYTLSRTRANIITALLAAGKHQDVIDEAQRLLALPVRHDDWSDALIGLDLATAVARMEGGSSREAVALGLKAVAGASVRPIASVVTRTSELADELRNGRASGELNDVLSGWRATTRGVDR